MLSDDLGTHLEIRRYQRTIQDHFQALPNPLLNILNNLT